MNVEQELAADQEKVAVAEPTQPAPAAKVEISDGSAMSALSQRDQQVSRQDRHRQQMLASQARNKNKPDQRQVDHSKFKSAAPTGRVANPTRVKVCKEWIDAFNRDCHSVSADPVKRRTATNGLFSIFSSLTTMNRLDTHEVLDHMVATIESSNTGAWDRRIIFANLKFLPTANQELMNRMLQLMTLFAECEDRTKIRTRTEPKFAIDLYVDTDTRANLQSYFPAIA